MTNAIAAGPAKDIKRCTPRLVNVQPFKIGGERFIDIVDKDGRRTRLVLDRETWLYIKDSLK